MSVLREYDECPPTNKAELAMYLADLYDYESELGAAPLPKFDEFIHILARPRWEWTPKASKLFRRIRRIRNRADILSDPAIYELTIHELLTVIRRKKRAFGQINNWAELLPEISTDLPTPACTVGSIDASDDAPTDSTACTTSIDRSQQPKK